MTMDQAVTRDAPSGKKTLVIENLSLFTLPFGLWMSWRCKGGYFVGCSKLFERRRVERLLENVFGLQQLCYEDFPGSYTEIQGRATNGLNDAFFDTFRKSERAAVLNLLRDIRPHPLMEVALRRELLDLYTMSRVKTLVFLRRLTGSGKPVLFIPDDNRDPQSWVSPDLISVWEQSRIPRWVRFYHAFKLPFETIGLLISIIASAVFLLFQRGFTFRRPEVRKWKVGFDIYNWGITWDNPTLDFFLYDTASLSPQNILHVVRNQLGDVKTRRYFAERNIPFVEGSKLAIQIGYFFKNIFWGYVRSFWNQAIRHLLKGWDSLLLRAASVVVFRNLIRLEILESGYQTDVFVSRDEYSIAHILRTMFYDARGGKTIGFSHGDDCFRVEGTSYLCDHVYCFPGDFHKQLLARNSRFSKETRVIGAGLYGLDATFQDMTNKQMPQLYEEIRRSGVKLVGIFASTYQKNLFVTRDSTFRFYRAAFSLLEAFPDIKLVIRPKTNDLELKDPEFHRLLTQAGDRVILEDKLWTYKLLPALDLMICIATSTVGLEGLVAGIPVVYYDEGEISPHPYGQYDEKLLARSPSELAERVGGYLRNSAYAPQKTLDFIRQHHGLRFDGKVTSRFREIVSDTLEAAVKGAA